MSRFEQVLRSARAIDIALVTCSGAVDYLCFTRFLEEGSSWVLGVSDGATVYTVKLSEEDLKARSGGRDYADTLAEISTSLREESRVELTVPSPPDQQLTLRIKCPSGQEEFFLVRVPTDDGGGGRGKRELGTLLFSLARRLATATSELTECKKDLEDLRRKMGSDQPAYADVTMRSAASKAVTRPKKPAGHSLVNPSAKRRKAATGVVFGSQDS